MSTSPVHVFVARRTSLQCPTLTSSSSAAAASARSKPPPPVRRTSSVTGTRPMMLQSPTAECCDRRESSVPSGVPAASPSRRSPRHAVRVSPAAPRRSLSTAYADLCQTLNDQLAARVGGPPPRRPGAERLSAADGGTSPATARQSSPGITGRPPITGGAGGSTCDSLLMDIKRGVCLRPTVSNDRSAPCVHRSTSPNTA